MSLREDIELAISETLFDVLPSYETDNAKEYAKQCLPFVVESIEEKIDEIEQDYKSKLTDWGKQQPMKEMYPKEMDALGKVREMLK